MLGLKFQERIFMEILDQIRMREYISNQFSKNQGTELFNQKLKLVHL